MAQFYFRLGHGENSMSKTGRGTMLRRKLRRYYLFSWPGKAKNSNSYPSKRRNDMEPYGFISPKNFREDQRGITGLETANVLIAFAVLSTGLLSLEKSKETVRGGLPECTGRHHRRCQLRKDVHGHGQIYAEQRCSGVGSGGHFNHWRGDYLSGFRASHQLRESPELRCRC